MWEGLASTDAMIKHVLTDHKPQINTPGLWCFRTPVQVREASEEKTVDFQTPTVTYVPFLRRGEQRGGWTYFFTTSDGLARGLVRIDQRSLCDLQLSVFVAPTSSATETTLSFRYALFVGTQDLHGDGGGGVVNTMGDDDSFRAARTVWPGLTLLPTLNGIVRPLTSLSPPSIRKGAHDLALPDLLVSGKIVVLRFHLFKND
jgi:hypothetical protein